MSEDLFKKHGRKAKAGEVLFEAGETGKEMYVVRKGSIRISIESRGGVDKTLAILGAGEFVGEMSLLTDRPRSAKATVEEDVELLVVGVKTLEEMIIHNTEIALRLVRKLASRLVSADSLIKVLLHRDAKERIIENIKRLAEMHKDEDGTSARFKADINDMAEQVGLNVKETEEIMMRLLGAGFIENESGDWVISNIDDIEDFLNFLRLKEQYR